MPTYNEVLNQALSLTLAEQLRLLEDLTAMVRLPVQVEGDENEIVPAEEIAQSEAAWQDYLAGRDRGISSKALKLKLFGEKLD